MTRQAVRSQMSIVSGGKEADVDFTDIFGVEDLRNGDFTVSFNQGSQASVIFGGEEVYIENPTDDQIFALSRFAPGLFK